MAMVTATHSTTKVWQVSIIRGNRGTERARTTYPNVRKGWVQRRLAIQVEMLRHDGHNRHENSQKTVLEDTDPDYLHSQYIFQPATD